MPQLTWQKSSHCGEGDSCVHVAATPTGIHITESADPGGVILTLSPDAFRTLLHSLKEEPHRDPQAPALEVTTSGDDGRTVLLHAPGTPPSPPTAVAGRPSCAASGPASSTTSWRRTAGPEKTPPC
ncbi:DUF397 domain-containing protein [Streptomyces sp. NPDC057238]|uniref:DUF397 domain-containing protein n=1 Tax=Streptomyces sp. NPDC057238 TaxID=3346060 RepID=UPI00363CA818